MAAAEKFCLRWNDFEANISSAFRELREDKDFFDVTLACDDDQIQAHKVILSACSPFFRTVLRRNRHEHPLLYLKGVKYVDLVAVLNFMYHGEVNVAQEELNSFLAVAEDLKVKGLTQNNQEKNSQSSRSEPPRPHMREPPERIESIPSSKRSRPSHPQFAAPKTLNFHDDDDIQEVAPVKSEPLSEPPLPSNPVVGPAEDAEPQYEEQGVVADPNLENSGLYSAEEYGDYGNYEDVDGSMLAGTGSADGNKDVDEVIRGMSLRVTGESGISQYHCTMCEYMTQSQTNLTNHIEKQHLNQSYFCPECGKELKSRHALKTHIHRIHNEDPQVCQVCQKIFSSKKNLKSHMKTHTNLASQFCVVSF